MKYKINILGEEQQVRFWRSESAYNKSVKMKDIDGAYNGHLKTIDILIPLFGPGVKNHPDDRVYEKLLRKVVWHEIGHGVDSEIPVSIVDSEFTSSRFEAVPHIWPQIEPIIQDVIKKVNSRLVELSKKAKKTKKVKRSK